MTKESFLIKKDNKMKIVLQNEAQKALMEHEMTKQIADGYWKNYSTEYEWKYFIDAEMVVDPDALSVRYEGYHGRPFNFLDKNLYEIFGERMKWIYAISMIAPNDLNIMLQYFSHNSVDKFIEMMPIITDKMVKKELKALNLGFKM